MSRNVRRISSPIQSIDLDTLLPFSALIGGVIVNTCGYIRQEGYESFKHVAKAFDGKSY